MRRAAILVSGSGSNMVALVEAMRAGQVPAEPVLVLSNRPGAGALDKAADRGVATAVVDHTAFADRERFDAAVHAALEAAGAEIVACAGYLRIMTAGFVARWQGRMLNIHPSLLPGLRGLDTHARALAAGCAIHGCTVHEVVPELDAGPILGQAAVPVLAGDTAETLAARVLAMEHRLYPAVLARFLAGDRTPLALFGELPIGNRISAG